MFKEKAVAAIKFTAPAGAHKKRSRVRSRMPRLTGTTEDTVEAASSRQNRPPLFCFLPPSFILLQFVQCKLT